MSRGHCLVTLLEWIFSYFLFRWWQKISRIVLCNFRWAGPGCVSQIVISWNVIITDGDGTLSIVYRRFIFESMFRAISIFHQKYVFSLSQLADIVNIVHIVVVLMNSWVSSCLDKFGRLQTRSRRRREEGAMVRTRPFLIAAVSILLIQVSFDFQLFFLFIGFSKSCFKSQISRLHMANDKSIFGSPFFLLNKKCATRPNSRVRDKFNSKNDFQLSQIRLRRILISMQIQIDIDFVFFFRDDRTKTFRKDHRVRLTREMCSVGLRKCQTVKYQVSASSSNAINFSQQNKARQSCVCENTSSPVTYSIWIFQSNHFRFPSKVLQASLTIAHSP